METMKRKWGKPMTEVQQFTPNEYCVVCWGAGGKGGFGGWLEENGIPGVQVNPGTAIVNGVSVSYERDHQFLTTDGYYEIQSDMTEFVWILSSDRPSTAPSSINMLDKTQMAYYTDDSFPQSYLVATNGDIYYHMNQRPSYDPKVNHS